MTSEHERSDQTSSDNPLTESEDSDHAHRKKPFISRLLGKFGMETSSAVDWIFDWVQILLIAGLLAWFTMSYATVRMQVPTGSMIPTIEVGDSFFVDKLTYTLGFQKPEQGDIVVFWREDGNRLCSAGLFGLGGQRPCRERFVKRLVAIGPAEVRITQGKLLVDGVELTDPAFDRDYVCDNSEARDPTLRRPDQCEPYRIPEGHFFLLGDNTRNSSDSRVWGTVPNEDFIGEPFLRVLPPARFGPMNGYFGSAR